MVLICHRHEFIYLKTHKTASTSVELALEPYCAPEGHEIFPNRKNMLETDFGIIGARAAGPDVVKARQPGFFWNHMAAERVLAHIGPEMFGRYRKVACVRNPFKRLLSQFFFLSVWAKDVEAPESLDEAREKFRAFLMTDPRDKSNLERVKTDYHLVHIDDEFVLDDVLRVENLRADITSFLERVGVEHPSFDLTRERDNAEAKRSWTVMDFFHDAELVDRALELEDWVFRTAHYSPDPRAA